MLDRVGQCLLDNAEHGERQSLRKLARLTVDAQPHLQRDAPDQVLKLFDPRLRLGYLVVAPQHAEQQAQVGEGSAPRAADGGDGLSRLADVFLLDRGVGTVGLDNHEAHAVRDDVV